MRSLELLDCHTHICPDQIAARNKELIENASGITPVYDGSVGQLGKMMEKVKIKVALANNIVLRPALIQKANDFTARAVANSAGALVGMGCIAPGEVHSAPEEVQRCKLELGFPALKMHHSHFKVLPSDPRNDKIYERIVEFKMAVLFHCGKNPYASEDSAMQYSMPGNFLPVLKSYPEMKVILGHLAGYQDSPEQALELLAESRNTVADTAVDVHEKKKNVDFKDAFEKMGINRIVFGSDYPIHDAASIVDYLQASLDPAALELVAATNLRNFLPL